MTQTNTRELLIDEGLKALLAGGYDGTGIGPVLKAAGVPKGSFYHFFDSKEAFALAVLDAYAEHYGRARREILHDRSRSPLERLRRYFTYMSELLAREDFGGCLFGNLALASATRSPAFRERLQKGFRAWQSDLTDVLQDSQAAGEIAEDLEPEETAAFLIDAYEGALLRAKSEGDTIPLERFVHLTLTRVLSPPN
ncbi:TetR family transcriptional regulator C-terminal domain-containing protein [Fodinicurvata halophila]|uniref:TetR family transcriptional regulator C-terminal domain-containing protein n=1 Tax=Fodinicurvata halophila TaxID=1419723 RepID=A0ABV8UH34_9PROT